MSKYDEERKKILERMQKGNVSFSSPSTSKYASERSAGKSKYDEERQALYNPVEQPKLVTSGGTKAPGALNLSPWLDPNNRIAKIAGQSQPDENTMRANSAMARESAEKQQSKSGKKEADNKAAKGWLDEQSRNRQGNDFFPEPVRNVLDSVAGFADKLQVNNPVGRFLNRFSQTGGNVVGVDTQAAGAAPMLSTGSKIADTTADVAGAIGGFATNPSNISQNLFTAPYQAAQSLLNNKAGQAALTKGLNLINPTLNSAGVNISNRIGQRGVEGAIAGGIQGATISGTRFETDAKEVAKNTLMGAAFGGVADAGLSALGSVFGKLFQRNGIPDEQAQEILALPMGRADAARMRGVNAPGTEPIVTPYTFGLPEGRSSRRVDVTPQSGEPLGLPAPRLEPPTTARRETGNPYRNQFEQLMREAQRMQSEGRFTPGREDIELEQLWGSMAGRNAPALDELITLAYKPRPNRVTPDLVGKARGYQQSRQAAGAPLPVRDTADRLPPQGMLGNVDSPITVPKGERYGVFSETASPQTEPRISRGATNQPEVMNADIVPNRPRLDVTPEREVEEILQSSAQPRVRDRIVKSLDEAEKAARERIAARKGRLNSNPLPEWGDHAIIMAAQLGRGTIKTADFTEALVREFGENVRPHAQQILSKTREVLRTQERLASKEAEDARVFNEGEGNADTFSQKISKDQSKKKVPWSQRWEKIRTQATDDLAPLEGLEKRIKGKVGSAESSLYKAARMFKGVPEKAAQRVQTSLSPIVQAVERAGYTADDLGKYALARHAQDVNASGYKSGFTNAEIDDVLRRYGTPEMETARKQLVQVNKNLMKELVDSGVVSKELADVLDNRWQNYIPLFRAFDDESVEFGTGLSKALANVASPIKALKGSERAVIDPLENMVKNIYQSMNAAERNKVASQLAELSKSDPDGILIRQLKKDEEVGRKNVVNVKVNGENVKYEVEPEVYKALLNLDAESSNMLIKVLSKPASLLRSGATITPEFSLRNPMRDVNQAYVVSKSGFNPLIDFPVGVAQAILGKYGKGKLYQEWIDELGAYGNVLSMDRNVHKEALQKVFKEPLSKKLVNIINPAAYIRLLRAISDTTESATKIGEYRAAKRSGVTNQEAAFRSRDIMDFARAGTSIRQTNRIVAFLNASIQGNSRLIRSIKENPGRTTAKAFTSVTLPTVGIFMMQKYLANEKQKETINDAAQWQKDTFWLMPIPGTDVVARIPKPFGLNLVFANPVERLLNKFWNDDPNAFDGFANSTMKGAAIPTQISGLLPLIEGMSDYSFFRQGQIIPQRDADLEFKDQYDPVRTTEAAKLLAKGADKLTGGSGPFKNFASPYIMDNTIKGLTAGLGTYATSAVDSMLQGKVFGWKAYPSVIDRPEAPAKRLEQRPLAKAFLVDPMQGGKPMDTFYSNLDKLKRERSSASLNEKAFTKEPMYDYLNRVSGAMNKINKAIRQIERGDLTAGEKRRQIEPLINQRNQLAKEAVKDGDLR